jgi:hypothetical protein
VLQERSISSAELETDGKMLMDYAIMQRFRISLGQESGMGDERIDDRGVGIKWQMTFKN